MNPSLILCPAGLQIRILHLKGIGFCFQLYDSALRSFQLLPGSGEFRIGVMQIPKLSPCVMERSLRSRKLRCQPGIFLGAHHCFVQLLGQKLPQGLDLALQVLNLLLVLELLLLALLFSRGSKELQCFARMGMFPLQRPSMFLLGL